MKQHTLVGVTFAAALLATPLPHLHGQAIDTAARVLSSEDQANSVPASPPPATVGAPAPESVADEIFVGFKPGAGGVDNQVAKRVQFNGSAVGAVYDFPARRVMQRAFL